MTDRETPWWASDDPAGHAGGGREDASDAGGGARSNGQGHGGGQGPTGSDQAGWGAAGAGRIPDLGPIIDGVVRALGSQFGRATSRVRSEGVARADGPGRDHVCDACPVCTLLRAIDDTHPDVVAHLVEAARHLTEAAKVMIDAQADRIGGAGGIEHIPVDD